MSRWIGAARLAGVMAVAGLSLGCGSRPGRRLEPLPAGTEVAEESVFLVPGLSSGDRWSLEHLYTEVDDAEAGKIVVRAAVEVVKADGGMPRTVRIDFTPESRIYFGGLNGETIFDFAGKSGVIRVDGSGATEFERLFSDHYGVFLQSAVLLLVAPPPYLPETPRALSVGDEWETTIPDWLVARGTRGEERWSVSCKTRLVRVVEIAGRKIVELDAKRTATRVSGETTVWELTETVRWDLEAGVVVEVEGRMSWTIDATETTGEALTFWSLRRAG